MANKDQQAELEQVAREWLIGCGFCHRNYDGELTPVRADVDAIVTLLAAERVKMLEEVFAGLKVSNDKLQWALKELGPTGTNAEACIKAAVEYLIFVRAQAQEQRP